MYKKTAWKTKRVQPSFTAIQSSLKSYSLYLLCEILCHYASFFLLFFMFPYMKNKKKNISESTN